MPKIFEHYRLHQLMNPKVGFMDYISEHYMGDDGIESDDAQDRELPFKNNLRQGFLHAIVPPVIFYTITRFYSPGDTVFPTGIPEPVISPYKHSLLRPPRIMA